MKNGKDRNVYDVMNDVNVDIETMDMSDEEKDACVKRLRHKVKARETGRNHGWKTAAAADRKCYSIKICGRELHK